jgi:hypothetical protein
MLAFKTSENVRAGDVYHRAMRIEKRKTVKSRSQDSGDRRKENL